MQTRHIQSAFRPIPDLAVTAPVTGAVHQGVGTRFASVRPRRSSIPTATAATNAAHGASLVVLGAMTFMSLPREFAPPADVGRAFITIEGPEGSSYDYMESYARRLEAIIVKEQQKHGDIEHVLVRVPGGWGGGTGDVNSARAIVLLKDWRERTRTAREVTDSIMNEASKMAGVRVQGHQPSSVGRRGVGRGGFRGGRRGAGPGERGVLGGHGSSPGAS